MRNDYNLSSQRFMTELDSPETHIYISTRGYRGCLNSACEIENLEGTLREKWSCKLPLKWSTNRCSCTTTFTLNAKNTIIGNNPDWQVLTSRIVWKCAFHLTKTWIYNIKYLITKEVCSKSTSIVFPRIPYLIPALAQSFCMLHVAM